MPLVNRNDTEKLKQLIIEGFLGKQDNQKAIESKILEGIEELKTKLDQQNKTMLKLSVVVSKMYAEGEINKETFNKLDDFLKPYYDNPYGVE